MWAYIRTVRWAIATYLEDVPNSYLRFEDNKALFILLTLKRGPKWFHKVDELHPKVHDYHPWERYCWCEATYGDGCDRSTKLFEVGGPL